MSVEKHQPDWTTSLQSLLATVVIAVFVITFVVQAFQIPSESMENTLLIGDYLLVDKLRYGGNSVWDHFLPYRKVHRGDIIVFRYPVNPSQHFVKRVVGIPGDHIRLINRQVYVNEIPLQEPYVRYSSRVHDAFRDEFPRLNIPVPGLEGGWWLQMKKLVDDNALIVPEGSYFVLGDNQGVVVNQFFHLQPPPAFEARHGKVQPWKLVAKGIMHARTVTNIGLLKRNLVHVDLPIN